VIYLQGVHAGAMHCIQASFVKIQLLAIMDMMIIHA